MTMDMHVSTNWRRPSSRYIYHFALACLGLAALIVALGADLRYRTGLDATDGLDHEGLLAFLFAGGCQFLYRLIFWERVSPQSQNLVRNAISLVLSAELLLAVITVLMVVTQDKPKSSDQTADMILITVFTLAGALCQISTVIWLLRYRKE